MTEEPVSLMSIYAGSFMPLRPPPSLPLHPKPSMVDRPEGARLGPRPDGVSIVQILPKARWRAVVIGQSEAHPPEQTRNPPGKGKVMQSSHSQQQVLSILPGMDELQPTPAPADASHPPKTRTTVTARPSLPLGQPKTGNPSRLGAVCSTSQQSELLSARRARTARRFCVTHGSPSTRGARWRTGYLPGPRGWPPRRPTDDGAGTS